MTFTQSTGNGESVAPSSPLRQMSESQSAGDRTPRASGTLAGRESRPPQTYYFEPY